MILKPDKTCPKCDSDDYRFRGRKVVEDGAVVETKYRCAPCGHVWKVRVAATALTVPTPDQALPPLWEVDAPENLA